jgi:hypothetical protein
VLAAVRRGGPQLGLEGEGGKKEMWYSWWLLAAGRCARLGRCCGWGMGGHAGSSVWAAAPRRHRGRAANTHSRSVSDGAVTSDGGVHGGGGDDRCW